ncbi:MAG: DUF202 domain-containing protein [Solirubrobacterales bacterium]|nr:DUF202 domain-containing protein [Solirubrobacterales bacterium]
MRPDPGSRGVGGTDLQAGLATERTTLAEERTDLATERTTMAEERTRLAWWRTGLTAFAVAIGVGRLLPELAPNSASWPYIALGVAFAIYGIALFSYGTRWARKVEQESGAETAGSGPDRFLTLLTVAGIALGLGTILVILLQ